MTCSSLETALQARQAQDGMMASQLRAAQHLLQCEKLETQALSHQVRTPQLKGKKVKQNMKGERKAENG